MPGIGERMLRFFGLARVTAQDVGRADDGLLRLPDAGTALDKRWEELYQEFTDALDAWRKNPLARRIVGLVSAYVVGDGIRLTSDYRPLGSFLARWMAHEQNQVLVREHEWCDELTRTGELFVVLHTNPADGMSYVRTLPASVIDKIETAPGDYESELAYHELVAMDDPDYSRGGRVWLAFDHPDAGVVGPDGRVPPVVLHFAVNRPVGCVRGESDLAPILPWLRRYSRWLEDRVRLNAAVRAYLWIVRVPGRLIEAKRAQYATPPEAGSVIIAEQGAEEWQAVAPGLQARDAEADGRAIRWMIAAGGPGIGLVDLGEAEDANLATARAMGEQRIKFMRRRQAYFGQVLAQAGVTAYNRAVRLGRLRGRECTVDQVLVALPDVSAADNAELGSAAAQVAGALAQLAGMGFRGPAWRRLALRLVLRFAGEQVGDQELAQVFDGGA